MSKPYVFSGERISTFPSFSNFFANSIPSLYSLALCVSLLAALGYLNLKKNAKKLSLVGLRGFFIGLVAINTILSQPSSKAFCIGTGSAKPPS